MSPVSFTIPSKKNLQELLIAWYAAHKRDLPWRKLQSPYQVWISEVMLQQTQVKTVLPYYRRFLKRFATLYDLASANQQQVLKYWQGLGYYARARNLHKAAVMICKKNGGKIPDDLNEFKKLPGVGDYIGSAVLSIAFNKPLAVVDSNVKRVLARLFCRNWAVNDPAYYIRFKQIADQMLDKKRPGEFNQAVMELGALICTPQKPLCQSCPLQLHCKAFQTGAAGRYPLRRQVKKIPLRHRVAGVIIKNGKVLITRRPSEGLLGGMWEFPSGAVNSGQKAADACLSTLQTKVNQSVSIKTHLVAVRHTYTHFKLKLDVFICEHTAGRIRLNGPAGFKWVSPQKLKSYPMHKANLKILPALEKFLSS